MDQQNEKLPSPYFRADETVPETGVYRIFHSDHRLSHEAVLLRATRFPRCIECGTVVRYELVHPAPEVERDPDFVSRRIFEISHPPAEPGKKRLA